MNAILREYEAPVLTNEAIEVHLSYLRPAVEGLAQKLDQVSKESVARDEALASKVDQLNETLSGKIDKVNETLNGKIDKVDETLSGKIDKVDETLSGKIDKVNETLSGKLEQTNKDLTERFSKIQGSIDGLKWFIASIALILSGLSIAHNLNWI